MKMIVTLSLLIFLSISQNIGIYKMKFKDFDNFIAVNARHLTNKTADIHPSLINGNAIDDFVFNIGLSTKTKCDREAIACIKYKGDKNYYSVSSARAWNISETGINISFMSNISVKFILPPSINSTLALNSRSQVQLVIEFTFSEATKITLTSQSLSNLLLVISDKSLKQYTFDPISLYCFYARFYIGAICFCLGLFLIIPSSKLYRVQIGIAQIISEFLLSLVVLYFMYFCFFIPMLILSNILIKIGLSLLLIGTLVFHILCLKERFKIYKNSTIMLNDDNIRRETMFLPFISVSALLFNILIAFCLDATNGVIEGLVIMCIIILYAYFCYLFFNSKKYKLYLISYVFLGSYLFTRGLSVFLGGYPNELEVQSMGISGIKFPLTFFYYLIGIILIPVIHFFIYFRAKQSKEILKTRLNTSSIEDDSKVNINSSTKN